MENTNARLVIPAKEEMKELVTFTKRGPWHSSPFPMESGWGNGYVILPANHPYHGIGYDFLPCDAHGGLTFASAASDCVDDFLPEGADLTGWVIGFDTAHAGDNSDEQDYSFVVAETERIKQQMLEAYDDPKAWESRERMLADSKTFDEEMASFREDYLSSGNVEESDVIGTDEGGMPDDMPVDDTQFDIELQEAADDLEAKWQRKNDAIQQTIQEELLDNDKVRASTGVNPCGEVYLSSYAFTRNEIDAMLAFADAHRYTIATRSIDDETQFTFE